MGYSPVFESCLFGSAIDESFGEFLHNLFFMPIFFYTSIRVYPGSQAIALSLEQTERNISTLQ